MSEPSIVTPRLQSEQQGIAELEALAFRRRIVVFKEPGVLGTLEVFADALSFPSEAMTLSAQTGSYIGPSELGSPEIFPKLGIAIVESMHADDLHQLERSGNVEYVLPDVLIGIPEELTEIQDVSSLGQLNVGGLQGFSDALMRLGIGIGYALRGDGITIAVIDTGIDGNHPDFRGRFNPQLDFKDFTDTQWTIPADDHGHGTHCAGLAAGPRDGAGGYGVAPGSRLVIGRALRRRGALASGLLSHALMAAAWSVARGARIISMSLGTRARPGVAADPALVKVASNLYDQGVVLVAACGNDSDRRLRPPLRSGLRQPAGWGMPPILAVAAVGPDDQVAYFSNAGPQTTIAAPGVDVYSAWPMTAGGFAKHSGTSQACPLVAGLLALDWQRNPELSSRYIVHNLLQNARILSGAHRDDVGAGLAQAPRA